MLFIVLGLVLIFIHWMMRFNRTKQEKISFFSGSTVGEAIYQWLGWILVIFGLLL